jgi:hypothetical protein
MLLPRRERQKKVELFYQTLGLQVSGGEETVNAPDG